METKLDCCGEKGEEWRWQMWQKLSKLSSEQKEEMAARGTDFVCFTLGLESVKHA